MTATRKRLQSVLAMKRDSSFLALDFDGVICASSEESSHSAIIAAKNFWPLSFQNIDMNIVETFQNLQHEIMYLRPIIETGYENMLIARYLNENEAQGKDVERQWGPFFRDQLIQSYKIPKVCCHVVSTYHSHC